MAHDRSDSYLDPVALNATPGAAFASHRARANGIARYYAYTHPLEGFVEPTPPELAKFESVGWRFDEDTSMALIAHLHAADEDPGFKAKDAKEASGTLVSKVLRGCIPGDGQVGTNGDYDMAHKGLMTATFRYRHLSLPPPAEFG